MVLWFCCFVLVVWATIRTKERTQPKNNKMSLFESFFVVHWFGVVVFLFVPFFVLFDSIVFVLVVVVVVCGFVVLLLFLSGVHRPKKAQQKKKNLVLSVVLHYFV